MFDSGGPGCSDHSLAEVLRPKAMAGCVVIHTAWNDHRRNQQV
jgi:hypothetical protein